MTTEAQEKRATIKRERVKRREEDAHAVAEQERRARYRTAFEQVLKATHEDLCRAFDGDDGPLTEAAQDIITAAENGLRRLEEAQ